jgi:hypothetical protein
VFEPSDLSHEEFRPVLLWIVRDRGKMIYGGTRYKTELKKLKKCRSLIVQLKKAGKVIELDDDAVDQWSKKLSNEKIHPDFDDAHIIAIVIVSRCRIICTKEKRGIRFFKDSSLYPKGVSKPKLYTGKNNKVLLNHKFIVNICLPTDKGTKDLGRMFQI